MLPGFDFEEKRCCRTRLLSSIIDTVFPIFHGSFIIFITFIAVLSKDNRLSVLHRQIGSWRPESIPVSLMFTFLGVSTEGLSVTVALHLSIAS